MKACRLSLLQELPGVKAGGRSALDFGAVAVETCCFEGISGAPNTCCRLVSGQGWLGHSLKGLSKVGNQLKRSQNIFLRDKASQVVGICLRPVLICVVFLFVGWFVHSFVVLFGVYLSIFLFVFFIACFFLLESTSAFASDRLSALMEASCRAVSSVMRLSWSISPSLVLSMCLWLFEMFFLFLAYFTPWLMVIVTGLANCSW